MGGERALPDIRGIGTCSVGVGSHEPTASAASCDGMWNLDGKTDVDKGGQLTKAVAALECEARGLTVKRWADGTKNAGEVHSDVKLQELIKI